MTVCHVVLILCCVLFGFVAADRKHCQLSRLSLVPSDEAIEKAVKKLNRVSWANAKYHEKAHQIPKVFWLNGKEVPEKMHHEHSLMMQNNTRFKFVVFSDADADEFLTTVFKDTSYLWAYHTLNHQLGAGKADIFRYALLYVFGGVWLDMDDVIYWNLEDYIKPQDGFIVGAEPLWDYYSDHCYHDKFYLRSSPFDKEDFGKTLPWFNKRVMQSIIIIRPKHPLMLKTMENIVNIFQELKCKNSSEVFRGNINPQHKLLCSTGPYMLTASARQVAYEAAISSPFAVANLGFRYAGIYYKDIDGDKQINSRHGNSEFSGTHWKKLLDNGTSLLADFNVRSRP